MKVGMVFITQSPAKSKCMVQHNVEICFSLFLKLLVCRQDECRLMIELRDTTENPTMRNL